MNRKKYIKPDANHVLFYSEEELTLSLEEGMEDEAGGNGTGGGTSTSEGVVDKPSGWE